MILMDIEHELRAMDQARLTTDCIHFDSIEGQAWLNRVYQERLDELEVELFDTGKLKEEGTSNEGGRNIENAEEKTAEFVNRMCQITLEIFWTQEVKEEEGFERTDSMLEGLGAGWTASFLAKVYPKVSHYLIKEFLRAVVEVSIVKLLALFVTLKDRNRENQPLRITIQ